MASFNRILFWFWLALASGIFLAEWYTGAMLVPVRLGEIRLSIGWIALYLAGHNGFRWWTQTMRRQQAKLERAFASRRNGNAPPPPTDDKK